MDGWMDVYSSQEDVCPPASILATTTL